MVRGPKKHLKRLAAPKSWMLAKLGGAFTCKPSSGPHKTREAMPIALFLRNRLNYALNMKEVTSIMKQRLVKIDGKVRTDHRFPAGFMDVIQLLKVNENFRLIYDVKGRCVILSSYSVAFWRFSSSPLRKSETLKINSNLYVKIVLIQFISPCGVSQGYGEGYMRYANTAVKKVKKVVSAKSLQARSYDVSFDSYDVIRRRGVFYGA